ncbi:bifunctional 2-polyprenyl-6-hydroxyphenol methylase/3-demethylubiquinol 3-O-methyltransferase UbiG [Asticcacaulis sp. AND118]|nr:bifunctional 2-polyprenyl-6-hydroxyphenol methylase/3-demethylubiquinol 3-O-methyltransferase UbiG [Asticcacaulis sp. AND118]UDF03910.1 bifunctional 2-polyprenyl-6-hydroxyphenol methylase/3-demethylubiquinol 3-O-methyltransferase UbiG [Asticcacaulis sp. AND118]
MTRAAKNRAKSVANETDLAVAAPAGPSIDAEDVARFSALAARWWDPKGEFAPLHKFNPNRVRFIRDTCVDHFLRDPRAVAPFEGLRLIDIGCGGGLLSEPMKRMGFDVTGIDASEKNIGTAKAHAAEVGLDIRYLAQTVEQVVAGKEPGFDVVLTMEVIEHVNDPESFLRTCASLVKPGGLLFVATLNRTLKAHALGIVAAEYVLQWVPKGTHDWTKFLKPEEIEGFLQGTGLTPDPAVGVSYNPFTATWALSNDTSVNYMIVARRDLL